MNRIKRLLDECKSRIEEAEANLRHGTKMHRMSNMECALCGRRHPSNARKCHPCSNDNLRQRYCADETRVAEYFAILRQNRLFGTGDHFASLSCAVITERLASTTNHVKHACSGADDCPLKKELQGLLKDMSQLGKDAFDMQLPDILLQTLRSRDLSVLGGT